MVFAYYHDALGRVIYIEGFEREEDVAPRPHGVGYVVHNDVLPHDRVRVVNGVLEAIPEPLASPVPQRFNYEQGIWEDDIDLLAQRVRQQRDSLLAESDWTQLLDAELARAQREKWALYRKKLRRLTEQPGFPVEVVWPTPPGHPAGE